VKQHRRQEGAAVDIAVEGEIIGIAEHPLRFLADDRGLGEHVGLLVGRDECAHAGVFLARVADHGLGEAGRKRLDHRLLVRLGHDDAADGGAFLPRFCRHLAVGFLDEDIECGGAGGHVGAKDRGIQAVLLGDETHGVREDVGRRAQHGAGGRRAGETHHVLSAEPVEQIAGAAGDELQCALGQNAALQHHSHRKFRYVSRGGGGLDDGGHAGQQGRGELFQHPPDREVEGVDMQRDALQRHRHVLTHEAAGLAEAFKIAVEVDIAVGHLAAALRGKHEERADAAVDIELVVAERGTGLVGNLVKRLAAFVEIERELLEHRGALVKTHGTQAGAAFRSGEIQHPGKVERRATGFRDQFPVHRAVDGPGTAARGNPVSGGVAVHFE